MGGRYSYRHFLFAPREHGELALGYGIAPQAQVGLIRQHGLVDLVRPQIVDVKLRLWMMQLEPFPEARHLRKTDGVNGRHAHGTFGIALKFLQGTVELLFAPEDVAAELSVKLARVGK